MSEMKCGLCKGRIAGDQPYTIDHYKCSADLHQSLIAERDDLLAVAKHAELFFNRAFASGMDFGDDEHETWTALRKAIEKSGGGR